MKKSLLLVSLLIATGICKPVFAQLQQDPEEIHFTAWLDGAFDLIIYEGYDQVARFSSADDYNLGITEDQGTYGIDPGYTNVAMVATGNWQLKISAQDFMPVSGTGSIPISNLGVWCAATGVHQFGTEVSCQFTSADLAHGVTNSDFILIDLITDNSGNASDNAFTLHWLMGTMQNTMEPTSMFTQMSDGIFSQGQYYTNVVLTMVEVLP